MKRYVGQSTKRHNLLAGGFLIYPKGIKKLVKGLSRSKYCHNIADVGN